MRNRWDHEQPYGHQATPEDNTSPYCRDQVKAWAGGGDLIHPEIAMEIASWWQAPRNAFAPFQSTGTIQRSLKPEILQEISSIALGNYDEEVIGNIIDLCALLAYVETAQPDVSD